MNERLSPVFERLRRRTIYLEKDLSSPQKMVDGIIRLRQLKNVDPQNLFFDKYHTNPKLKLKKEIDPNKLATLIFTTSFPFDPKERRSLLQYNISLLQETLLGKNTDFLEGKKESDLILPAYVVLRSLKEKDSYWLLSAFKKMPYEKRKKLRENVEELFKKITPLQNLGIDLHWLYQEQKKSYRSQKEKCEVPPSKTSVKIGVPFKFSEKRSGTLINRDELITDDAKIVQYLTPQDKKSPFLTYLEKATDISVTNEGVSLGKDDLSLKIFHDTLEENKLRQTLQNNENLSTAFIISHFSRLKKGDQPHTSWLMQNNNEKTLAVISSFRDCLKTIFQRKEFKNLKKLIKNSFDPNLEKPDFNLFNRRVLEILFETYRKNGGNISNIESLIKEKGISESFFALRNLFFLRLLHNEMSQVSLGSFYSQPDNHLLFEIFQPFAKDLLFFQKTGRVRDQLSHISFADIIDLGFYFSFEKKILSWGRTSINPLDQKSFSYSSGKNNKNKRKYKFPPGMSFTGNNIIDFQGVTIPYRIEEMRHKGSLYKLGIIPIYKDYHLLSLPIIQDTIEKKQY